MDTASNFAVILRDNLLSLTFSWPDVVLVVGVLTLFISDLVLKRTGARVKWLVGFALGFLAVAGLSTWLLAGSEARPLFGGLLAYDAMGVFFRWLFLAATALGIAMAASSREIAPERMGEYLAMLLAMCLGMNLMASANDLLMVFVSVELVSLVSFLLAGYRRGDRRASEGSLKYVIYGSVASGVMVFGISYIYGLVGSTNLTALTARLSGLGQAMATMDAVSRGGAQVALLVAVIFVLAGIGYKIATVPFHMWCPDVYEGAPTPFTAFLSVGPKAAGFALALRFFAGGLSQVGPGAGLESAATIVAGIPWPAVLGVVAAITMTLGNFSALGQTNLKRLLAYSSIAHAGYIMMGLASGTQLGNMAVLLYLCFYLLMNIGAFLMVGAVARATGSESIFAFRGLGKRAPVAAVAMAVFLFSLAGLPPLAGFIGKFYLFYAVIVKATLSSGVAASGWWALVLIAVLNSALSLYYYARIVKAMFLEKSTDEQPLEIPLTYHGLMAGLAVLVLVFGIYWAPLSQAAEAAVLMMYRG